MAEKITAYTELKNKHALVNHYSNAYKEGRQGGIVQNVHALVATVFKKKGLEDLAKGLISSDEKPDMHALVPHLNDGLVMFSKEFEDYSRDNLEAVVNSKNLKKKDVQTAFLLTKPKDDIQGYEALSKIHKEANEFYSLMATYQSDQVPESQKSAILSKIKDKVIKDYEADFKDDKNFYENLKMTIRSYSDVALGQYSRILDTKLKEFNEKLDSRNLGKYASAALSDKEREIFYKILLSDKE